MEIDFSKLRKFLIPEFVFGEGAIYLAAKYISRFHAKKVFLVTDKGISKAGWLQKVEDILSKDGLKYVVFDEVTPNPKDTTTMLGAEILKSEKCDIILALGGGSPMDCAKGISIVVTNEKNVLEFEGIDEVNEPGLPLICLPTTAGTSADVSQFSIITDTAKKRKIAIVSKRVVPDVALIDSLTTTTMPAELTAQTGMDALVHAIEAYVSNSNSLITDLNALKAVQLIKDNLTGAYREPNNMEYRNNMMFASMLAGFAFSNAGLGLVHSMAHSLGGMLNLPHGECNSLLLKAVVNYNFDSAIERYYDITKIFYPSVSRINENDILKVLLEGIDNLSNNVGINYSLKDVGVKLEDIPLLAVNAYNDACLATNPKPVEIHDIEECFRYAF